MSVARAKREISPYEFVEWQAWRRLRHDPDDLRIARVCWLMAQLAGNKSAKIDDFLPRLKAGARAQSGQEIKARFTAAAAAIKRRKEALEERRQKREKKREARRGNKDRRRRRG